MTEMFHSKILSIIPAHPDAYLTTKITEFGPDADQRAERISEKLRIIAWATVERHYPGAETEVAVEAVFIDDLGPVNETAFRYQHSELTPEAGQPKVTVSFEYDLIY